MTRWCEIAVKHLFHVTGRRQRSRMKKWQATERTVRPLQLRHWSVERKAMYTNINVVPFVVESLGESDTRLAKLLALVESKTRADEIAAVSDKRFSLL